MTVMGNKWESACRALLSPRAQNQLLLTSRPSKQASYSPLFRWCRNRLPEGKPLLRLESRAAAPAFLKLNLKPASVETDASKSLAINRHPCYNCLPCTETQRKTWKRGGLPILLKICSWTIFHSGVPQRFWHPRLVLWKTIFPWTGERGEWFGDDLRTLHLLCTLFLLL